MLMIINDLDQAAPAVLAAAAAATSGIDLRAGMAVAAAKKLAFVRST